MLNPPIEAKIHIVETILNNKSLVLVGLMGAGKSAIGRRVANFLKLPFVDADQEIEMAAGQSIEDIFHDHGEAAFRTGEEKVIERLLNDGPCVLATGGGAFMSEKTRHNVKERGISLWIKADIDVLMERVRRRDNRPLLKTEDPRAVMLSLIEARYPVYATADITVESRDLPHELMVHEIIEELLKFDKTSLETRGERSK